MNDIQIIGVPFGGDWAMVEVEHPPQSLRDRLARHRMSCKLVDPSIPSVDGVRDPATGEPADMELANLAARKSMPGSSTRSHAPSLRLEDAIAFGVREWDELECSSVHVMDHARLVEQGLIESASEDLRMMAPDLRYSSGWTSMSRTRKSYRFSAALNRGFPSLMRLPFYVSCSRFAE